MPPPFRLLRLGSTVLPRAPLPALRVARFHASAPANVQVGDTLPNLEVLMENSPGNKVNLAEELGSASGRAVVIGVPAAFST